MPPSNPMVRAPTARRGPAGGRRFSLGIQPAILYLAGTSARGRLVLPERPERTDRRGALTSLLLWCGVIAGPSFVVAFLIEGATSPGYDPMRLPVSLLSLGEGGWRQVANFLVDGLLLLGFAAGVYQALHELGTRSTAGPLLLAIFAVGVIGAGLFSTDPGGGYPPGARYEPSLHGTLHDLVSLVVFTVLPVASLLLARRFAVWGERDWATYSATTGLLLAVLFVLMFIGFNRSTGISTVAGLIQRVWIVVGWGWLLLVAAHLLRRRAAVDAQAA
jgi:hypothetical protein